MFGLTGNLHENKHSLGYTERRAEAACLRSTDQVLCTFYTHEEACAASSASKTCMERTLCGTNRKQATKRLFNLFHSLTHICLHGLCSILRGFVFPPPFHFAQPWAAGGLEGFPSPFSPLLRARDSNLFCRKEIWKTSLQRESSWSFFV